MTWNEGQPMKTYIVIVNDRHVDIDAYPFYDKEKAILEARKIAHEYCHHPDSYEEHEFSRDTGWLFYAEYSTEGDYVLVIGATMDKEIEI